MTTKIQELAWVYVYLFIFILVLGYIPQFTVGRGYLFGIFQISIWDDLIHVASALAAAVAAFYSPRASIYYFRILGTLYVFDAIAGFFYGRGFLDLEMFLHDPLGVAAPLRLATVAPHLVIGLFALYVGFILSRKYILPTQTKV